MATFLHSSARTPQALERVDPRFRVIHSSLVFDEEQVRDEVTSSFCFELPDLCRKTL